MRDIPSSLKFEVIMKPFFDQFKCYKFSDEDDELDIYEPVDSMKYDYECEKLISNWKRDGDYFSKQFIQHYYHYEYYANENTTFWRIPIAMNLWGKKQFGLVWLESVDYFFIEGPLKYLSEELLNDRDIVSIAISKDPLALEYASPELRNQRDLVMEAVKLNGSSLEYASPELKNDKEIVLEAVRNDGYAIIVASEEMMNDREVDTESAFRVSVMRKQNIYSRLEERVLSILQ